MNLKPTFVASILAAAGTISLIAILPMPYGWYMLTRLAVCVAGITTALHFYGRNDSVAAAAVIFSLLFNPIQPISLGRPLWMLVDLVVGVVALGLSWYIRKIVASIDDH